MGNSGHSDYSASGLFRSELKRAIEEARRLWRVGNDEVNTQAVGGQSCKGPNTLKSMTERRQVDPFPVTVVTHLPTGCAGILILVTHS